jgi:hypothetical protein
MSNSTSSKIEEAKDHIRDAKNDIKTASQEKTAEKIEQVGEKIQSGMHHLAEKISPEEISVNSKSKN